MELVLPGRVSRTRLRRVSAFHSQRRPINSSNVVFRSSDNGCFILELKLRFPSLLCRKICRNCKCGLTEHNVQMNTEENKKVGKLFEDTKYTGLIAKLKKDGIPSYKGNMITITLPSPATAHVIPPSASAALLPPAGPAGVAQPAAAPTVGAPTVGAPNNTAPQAVSAAATPVRGNLVPVHVSTASANVAPVPKDAPMKSVTYEWAPPVANKHLVGVQADASIINKVVSTVKLWGNYSLCESAFCPD